MKPAVLGEENGELLCLLQIVPYLWDGAWSHPPHPGLLPLCSTRAAWQQPGPCVRLLQKPVFFLLPNGPCVPAVLWPSPVPALPGAEAVRLAHDVPSLPVPGRQPGCAAGPLLSEPLPCPRKTRCGDKLRACRAEWGSLLP